jgi:hypothetical protein
MVNTQASVHALRQFQERRHQVTVELDDFEDDACVEQRQGNRAATGPDLQQPLPGARRDGGNDLGDYAGRVQEMLAQSFLRFVVPVQEALLSAAIMASAMRRA